MAAIRDVVPAKLWTVHLQRFVYYFMKI